MGVCLSGACGCPDWIITLALVGGAVIYALIGALIFYIVKAFKEDLEYEYIALFILLWPILIIGGIGACVVYYVARLLVMPIIGAEKADLVDLEEKMDTKIKKGDEKVMDYLKYEYKPSGKKEAVKTKVKAKPGRKAKVKK